MRQDDRGPPLSRLRVARDAFLRTTRQMWKLVLGGVVLPGVGAPVGAWALLRVGGESDAAFAVSIAGLIVVTMLVAVLLGSIRCPRCRARLVVDAFRDPEGLGALTGLLQRRSCPRCAYEPLAQNGDA